VPPFICGWVILVAFLGGIASTALQATQQAVAMHMIYFGGFPSASLADSGASSSPASTQNAQFGIAVFVLCFSAAVSMLPMSILNRLAHASFAWLLFAATYVPSERQCV
jgi:hypothetical protein